MSIPLRVSDRNQAPFILIGALGAGVIGSPAISGGRLFATSRAGALVALRLMTGEPLWSTPLGGVTWASPALARDALGEAILVAPGLGVASLLRIDATDGRVVWRAKPDDVLDASDSSVAVAGDLVVLSVRGGGVHGLSLATGARR